MILIIIWSFVIICITGIWFLVDREDRTFGALRSNRWSQIRKEFLKENPLCAVCGTRGKLLSPNEVHHILPFHLNPALELSPKNFLTVCRHCHLYFAHLGSFKSYCIEIKELALEWKTRRENRPL